MKWDSNKKFETKLTPGVCKFTVIDTGEGISPNGGGYIKLKLHCDQKNGSVGYCNAFLNESSPWHIKDFFNSIGDPNTFDQEKIECDDLIGVEGYALIEIDAKGYPQSKKFITKEDAMKLGFSSASLAKRDTVQSEDSSKDFDDDIPF